MSIIQVELTPNDLIQAVRQLDREELSGFVSEVIALQARRRVPVARDDEAKLLQNINRQFSDEDRARRTSLMEKLEAEAISPAEHAELIDLNERAEMLNAERMESLAKLAEIRQKPLRTVMADLGILATNGN